MTGVTCLNLNVGGQLLRNRLPVFLLNFLQTLSFFPFFKKMPHSKKGRLAGGARKEINETRAAEASAEVKRAGMRVEIARPPQTFGKKYSCWQLRNLGIWQALNFHFEICKILFIKI